MLKTTVYILIFAICSLIACQANQNNSLTENIHDSTSALSTTTKDLDDYWILTDYIDSILKDKSIAKHSQYPILGELMAFRIHDDSLFSKGIDFSGYEGKISRANDTLQNFRYPYIFYYNNKSDKIEVTTTRYNSNPYFHIDDKKKYTYRRVKEKRLINILGMRSNKEFNQLFIDSLIVGDYKSVSNGQKLTMTNSRSMSGFKRYNKYGIYDYLNKMELDDGNPFNSYDAITFHEHRGNHSENDIPKWMKIATYNWRFSGDTLTLIEMKDTMMPGARFGKHFLGTKKFTFVRTK